MEWIPFCAYTVHMCCASLHIHISVSDFYKCICKNATHRTQHIIRSACRVLYHVFHAAFELWHSPREQFPVHVALSNEPLPALGALLPLIAVCGTQQLSTAAFHRWAGALRVAGHPQYQGLPAHTLPNVIAFQQPFESPALQDCKL